MLQVLFIGPDSAVQGIQSLLQRQRVAIGCRQVRFQACLRLSGFSRSGPRLFHGRPGRFFVLFPAGQSGLAGGDGLFQLFTVPDLLLQAFHSHLSLSGLGLPVRQGPVLGILAAQGLVLSLQGLASGFIGFGCHFPLLALAFTGFGPFLMLFDVVPFRQGFRAHSRQGMGFRAADRAGLALFQFRRQDSCLGLQEQGPDAFIGNAFVPGFGRRFFQEGPAVLPLFLRFFSLSFQLSRFAFALEPVVQGLPAGFGLFRRDGLFGQSIDGFPGLVQGLLFLFFFLSGLVPALFGVSHVFLALPFFEAADPIGSGLVLQACQLHLFFTGRLIALFASRKTFQLLLGRS